ncbi:FAD-dependent oxidoreductase, partial [Nonomuraea sp. NPDC050691]|uniref:FAD-dependent oxidoreductase n=1 Tax=Nonomuraea sp. NPDC050691 TaxID=3155661 RepID=UPI00340880B1
VDAARRAGADIRTGTAVRALRVSGGHVDVVTDEDTFRGTRVVLASGAWGLDLLPGVALPLRTQRSCLSWFEPADGGAGYEPERFPTFIRESGDLDGWGIPDVDGQGVKIGVGGTASKRWLERPEDNWHDPTPDDLAPVEDFTRRAFPGLRPQAVRAMACMNSKTPDGDFIIGAVGGTDRVVFAGGFSGHGFKHSPAVGLACAQLALDGQSEFDLATFSPDRFEDVR